MIFIIPFPWTFFMKYTINLIKVTRKCVKAMVDSIKILNKGPILHIIAESIIIKYIL